MSKAAILEPGATQTAVAKATTIMGSGSAVMFGLAAHELAALGGLVVAVLGFIYNIWVQERRLKMERDRIAKDSSEASPE